MRTVVETITRRVGSIDELSTYHQSEARGALADLGRGLTDWGQLLGGLLETGHSRAVITDWEGDDTTASVDFKLSIDLEGRSEVVFKQLGVSIPLPEGHGLSMVEVNTREPNLGMYARPADRKGDWVEEHTETFQDLGEKLQERLEAEFMSAIEFYNSDEYTSQLAADLSWEYDLDTGEVC